MNKNKVILCLAASLLAGCASHKPFGCRFVLLDAKEKIVHSKRDVKGGGWEAGWQACLDRTTFIENVEIITLNGHHLGVQMRGPKREKDRFYKFLQDKDQKEQEGKKPPMTIALEKEAAVEVELGGWER